MRLSMHSVAAAAAVLSLVGLSLAVANLSGGLGDIWQHWWSALPAVVLAMSAATLVLAWRYR